MPVQYGTLMRTMEEYCKIHTLFKRDERLRIIEGQWTLPEIEYLAGNKWLLTEKVDGTNVRVAFKDGEVSITGRTKDADFREDFRNTLNDKFNNDSMLSAVHKASKGNEIILFGEGFGPGINGGGKYTQNYDFVLFDVYVPTIRNPHEGTYVDGWWLHRNNCEDVASKLGLNIVPLVGEFTLFEAIEMVKAGFKSSWGDFWAEGIVAKTPVELFTRKGERLLTKIKHKDFLNVSEVKNGV